MQDCQWCGERHALDRLCRSAQREQLTRRSFCFLFSAGLAGIAGAKVLPHGVYSVPIDKSVVITQYLSGPRRLSFTAQKHYIPELGAEIILNWNGERMFGGHITEVVTQLDGVQRITAER